MAEKKAKRNKPAAARASTLTLPPGRWTAWHKGKTIADAENVILLTRKHPRSDEERAEFTHVTIGAICGPEMRRLMQDTENIHRGKIPSGGVK